MSHQPHAGRAALTLIAVLLAVLLAACSAAPADTATSAPVAGGTPAASASAPAASSAVPEPTVASNFNEAGFPIVNEPVTLTMMSSSNANHGPWEDMVLFQRMEELTNVHFEFRLVQGDAWEEQKNLAFATNDLPDVFFTGISTRDEILYGTQGKVLVDLTPYIDANMPNLTALFEKYPTAKPSVTAMDGTIYSMPYLADTLTMAGYTPYVRGDFMTKAGVERPATVDEFYDMLVAFKGLGDDIVPMTFNNVDIMFGTFLNAFGDSVDLTWTADAAGKVSYQPVSEQYERMLAFFNRLYAERLLDNETFTQSVDQANAKVLENKVGLTNYGTMLTAANYESGTVETQMLAPLTSEYSATQDCIGYNPISIGKGVVTTACETPEVWARWIDCFFSEEDFAPGLSGMSMWLGVYGEHWEYTDAEQTLYTRLVPDDTDLSEELWTNKYVTPGSGIGPCLLYTLAIPDNNPSQYMKATQSVENYYPYMVDPFPATLRYTEEEQDAIGTIETDIGEVLKTMRAEFVTGARPMSGFADFVAELENMGLSQVLATKQAAYDRFVAAQ